MRKKVRQVELSSAVVLEPMRGVEEDLEPGIYFRNLEDFIDRARAHLKRIPNPIYRAEVRRLYQELIENALDLKLKQFLKEKVA